MTQFALAWCMANPILTEHRFALPAQLRMHVESEIRNHAADLDCATYTKTSPRVLICTKNRATFGRKLQQHAADIQALRTLAAISAARANPFEAQLQRIGQAAGRAPQPQR